MKGNAGHCKSMQVCASPGQMKYLGSQHKFETVVYLQLHFARSLTLFFFLIFQNSRLYYENTTGTYYYYDEQSGTYKFHSKVDLPSNQEEAVHKDDKDDHEEKESGEESSEDDDLEGQLIFWKQSYCSKCEKYYIKH